MNLEFKVAHIIDNTDNIKFKEGHRLYQSLRKQYRDDNTVNKTTTIGYLILYKQNILYLGGSEAENGSPRFHPELGSSRIIEHSINLKKKAKVEYTGTHDAM